MNSTSPLTSFSLLLILSILTIPNVSFAQTLPQNFAHIGFLNKITGRFHDKVVPILTTVSFETLLIRVETCYRSNPGEKNESVAFFHISDTITHRSTENLFTGWMFASTPSLSSLEHGSYDVWLLECLRDPPAKTSP
jgi:hypothetical protein